MKLFKFRNSVRYPKVLIAILVASFSTINGNAQISPNFPTNQYPATQGGGYPVMLPTTLPPNAKQGINTTARPATTGTSSPIPRDGERNVVTTTPEEQDKIREDSIRLAIETAREFEDLRLEETRRKIFGYKLFNGVAHDPNVVVNIPTPNNYVLGTNDNLIIDTYPYFKQNYNATVDADGYIRIEQVGPIKISGYTIEEAREEIKEALRKANRLPGDTRVKISLGNVRSIKVTITGEAVAPGTYTMSSLSTIMNALYRSGGPNQVGSFREVRLVRNNKVISTLDLYDILINGFSKNDVLLQDQDVIVIPPFYNRVIIGGETKRTGYFELKPSETLKDGLNYAGGFGPDAYTHRIKVYRNNTREKEIFDVLYTDFSGFAMQTGDSISISKVLNRFTNLVNIEGAVFRPGEYSLATSPTLKTLIENAEGLREEALIGRVSIVRLNTDLTTSNISVNFKNILEGTSNDLELKREDLILVPSRFDLYEQSFIRISGAINHEDAEEGVELEYIKNMTLEDVLIRVGGLTEAASLSRVEIVRRKKNVDVTKANALISERIVLEVSPDLEVITGQHNITLEPYDELFVRKSPNYERQTYVELQGEVFYPAIYGIESKEERISDIIKRAGGLTLQAYAPGATLIRTVQLSERELEQRRKTLQDLSNSSPSSGTIDVEEEELTREEFIGIDLNNILRNPNSSGDLILRDGDIIRIPKTLQTVRIQGEVLYPTTVKYTRNAGLKEYISGAGGFTRQSLRRKSYVLYPNGSVDRTRKFLVFNVYPKIQPGSEIIVPEKAANSIAQMEAAGRVLTTISTTLGTIFTIYGFINLSKK
jgi:protein involved in polysaccharide export with SLBB domain